VAGFPCIDVSRAGLRRGLEGQSTGLVRHVFRLLQVPGRQAPQLPVRSIMQPAERCAVHAQHAGWFWLCCIYINSSCSFLQHPSAWPELQRAKDDRRAVPWVLLENVRPARLPREDGGVLREARAMPCSISGA
jgi:hypothetical protein